MGLRITRRDLIAIPRKLCLAFLLMAVQLAQPAAAASDPQEVVRGFYSVLLSNMRDGRLLGESGRLARLAPVVPARWLESSSTVGVVARDEEFAAWLKPRGTTRVA